ncbi:MULTISPECIES: response regulator transcription factor [Croceitalea]|uniref:Response regulator transcription factor n=1 Tax=Croceitalea vernalis TaxID=3075599 RepID=A0ABU3BHX5_9FLAO|nr:MULTISPECIES: response regulator transcription factor [unclassified Croceitalea]MDT0539924.1 response regulator transcription factor [Croceitalea sp. P059]MDT0621744.1 response regulator transcription factor [Croceitalea sp. P007]
MKKLPLKVIVIDNDEKMNDWYQNYFIHDPDYLLVETYTTVNAALINYQNNLPDIIISEVSLLGISGIDGIERFRKKSTTIKIIIASSKSDFELIKRAFKIGANGYLTKPISKERLFHALISVKHNGAALSYDVAKKVIATFQKKKYESFSKRENQIAEFLSQGATYKTIAHKLFVTPSTVNFHIQNIYLKLNVNSKSEALEKLRILEAS